MRSSIDVRIIAATHRDLEQWVREGRFREDLFYRLNVVPIAQPLRRRAGDIMPLAEHFLTRASSPAKQLSEDALQRLTEHAWPGNVRELHNAMERVAVMCRGEVVTAGDLDFLAAPPTDRADGSRGDRHDLSSAVEMLERRMIAEALSESGGNRAEAARRLGIHRQLLHAKAEKYGLGKRSRAD
jgi:two-component system NtrC family response regulator